MANYTDNSVDQDEVAYYERLAETWWDGAGPFWPLHRLNTLRVGYIRGEIGRHFGRDADASRPLAGLRILDIGCGGGILSEAVARLGAEVVGVDVVERNIRVARLHGAQQALDIDYRVAGARELARAGETFDVVLNMEVVEHVADLDDFLRDCCRLVRPEGLMFIATINRTPVAWLVAIVGAEYILRWLPRGTHRWGKFPRPGELAAILGRCGMRVARRTGVLVNPFTRAMRLSRLMWVNYMLVATLNGPSSASQKGRS